MNEKEESMRKHDWYEARKYTPEMIRLGKLVLDEIRAGKTYKEAVRKHPLPQGGYVPKHLLVAVYKNLIDEGDLEEDPVLLSKIRMKPVRSLSGVTTVTVLTKAYTCPGNCIFCPTEARMPKSYLADEPGAARAVQNDFDPYEQVQSRLMQYDAVGHPTDKIELLILGGSWDAYPLDYRTWFIKRCFDSMNGQEADTLEEAHRINETSAHRNVGLVVETRPDLIKPESIRELRSLGVTKVQMGAQSLNNDILEMNCRGHSAEDTLRAVQLLRWGGFKIVLHWMPNLLGATLDSDRNDFMKLWQAYCPDELKIYPTQLLESAELFQYWQRGEYHPYEMQDLIDLIAEIKQSVPRYCRINRVIRDISSTHVVAGNKRTSLRMDVLETMKQQGAACNCIRCREVRKQKVSPQELKLDELIYDAGESEEHFLSWVTADDKLAGYLRLSLPKERANDVTSEVPSLKDCALIREVHVYGQALAVGDEKAGAAQHIGLGTQLIDRAEQIAVDNGFEKLAVISAVGTRRYYAARGFNSDELYMVKNLKGE